jgi:hypothetical protein
MRKLTIRQPHVEYRQEQAKKVGLGFDLPESLFGLRGLQTVSNVGNKEAA